MEGLARVQGLEASQLRASACVRVVVAVVWAVKEEFAVVVF